MNPLETLGGLVRALPVPHRFRLVLGAMAAGLLAWLVVAADRPWNFVPPEEGRWRLMEYVSVYSFWAALINLGVLVVLLLTANWWAGRLQNPPPPEPAPRCPRWFWPLVVGAMIFCGLSAATRMNFGFAHDEDYSARRVVWGSYQLKKDGEVRPERLPWTETLFYYRKPNNHPLHTVLARLTASAWQVVAPAEKWHMKEWVVRLPAWVGGVAAVALLALLLRQLGLPRAGVVAAWLLALHPWFIRYASEARGYSLLMAFIPLCLLCWLHALRRNSWPRWLAFGAAQFALIYCYPGGAYILVVLNLLTLGWLGWQARRTRDFTTLGRWFAVNCLAGIVAVQLMLPLVPQLREYLKTEEARQPLTTEWFQNTASYFFVGAPWTKTYRLDSPHPELWPHVAGHPVLFGLTAGVLLLSGLLGYFLLFRRKWPDAPVVAATLLLPGFVSLIVAKLNYQWLFEWYLIYLLPAFAAGIAVGADWIGRRLENQTGHRWTGMLPALVLLAAYAACSQPFRHWYCTRALEPVKEATLAIRETLDPNDPRHQDRLTGVFLGKAWYYDPHAHHLKTPEEFAALMQRADQENKPLFIMAPHPWAVAFNAAPLWRLFHEAGLFTDYQTFLGFDQTHIRVVARYVPGSVRDLDLAAFLRGRDAVPNVTQPPLEHPEKPHIFPP